MERGEFEMNGCNDCKYKNGYDCTAPRSQWKFFDKDKGVESVLQEQKLAEGRQEALR